MIGFLIIEKFRTGKSCIRIRISGGQIDDLRRLNSGGVTGWGGWRAGQWWSRLWSRLSELVGWRCTCSIGSPGVCRFFAVPFWQGRQPDVWFWRRIAGCLCIAAFTFLCPGNSTPRFFSSQTSGRGILMTYFVSSIAARENPSFDILAIFNARRMSDCSNCTWPPCLAIVADMLKTYKTLVPASNNEIWLLPLPYTLRWPPLGWLMPPSSTHGDAYQEIHLQKSHSWQHHDVRFRGLCGQMPLSTMEVSRYGQRWICYVALYGHPLYVIQLIDHPLPWYGYTHISLHAASYFSCSQSCGQFLNVHPGLYVWWLHWQRHGELTCVCALVVYQECPYLL